MVIKSRMGKLCLLIKRNQLLKCGQVFYHQLIKKFFNYWKMIRVGLIGEIGSGKSFIAKQFGYPVFNADKEVSQIYKHNKICFYKLRNKLPKYIKSYPINKIEISKAILANKKNLKLVIKIVHPLVRKKMNLFIKKNINRKIVVMDIPLLVENKLYNKSYILVYIKAKKKILMKD